MCQRCSVMHLIAHIAFFGKGLGVLIKSLGCLGSAFYKFMLVYTYHVLARHKAEQQQPRIKYI